MATISRRSRRCSGKIRPISSNIFRRGSPKKLDEDDRRKLADFYKVDEQVLGAPAAKTSRASGAGSDLVAVKQLDLGASAGAGSLADDGDAGAMAFGPKWLKQLGADPSKLSLISVDGDSMDPTLCDGDDIMVDHSAAETALCDGIYVLRMDECAAGQAAGGRPIRQDLHPQRQSAISRLG